MNGFVSVYMGIYGGGGPVTPTTAVVTVQAVTAARMVPAAVHADVYSGGSVLAAGDWHNAQILWNMGESGVHFVTDPRLGTIHDVGLKQRGYNAGYVYDTAGTYTIQATITDNAGTAASDTENVTVVADTRTNYYFDATLGNDANVGSQASPKQTWSHAMSLAGNSVGLYFKRGEVFNVTASTTINAKSNLLISAYGTGAKPVINWSAANPGTETTILIFGNTGGSCENCGVEHLTIRVPLAIATVNVKWCTPTEMKNSFFRDVDVEGSINGNAPHNAYNMNSTAVIPNGAGLIWIGCTHGDLRDYGWVGACDRVVILGCNNGTSRDESIFRLLSNKVSTGCEIMWADFDYQNRAGLGSPFKDTIRLGWCVYDYLGQSEFVAGTMEIGFSTSTPAPAFAQDTDYVRVEECFISGGNNGSFLWGQRTANVFVCNCMIDELQDSARGIEPNDEDPANYGGTLPGVQNVVMVNNTIRRYHSRRMYGSRMTNNLNQNGVNTGWVFDNNLLLIPQTAYAAPFNANYATEMHQIIEEATFSTWKRNVMEDQGASTVVMRRYPPNSGSGATTYTFAQLNATTMAGGTNAVEDHDPNLWTAVNSWRPPSIYTVVQVTAAPYPGVTRDYTGSNRPVSGTWYAGCTDAIVNTGAVDGTVGCRLRYYGTVGSRIIYDGPVGSRLSYEGTVGREG